jgi:hypothetical protein
MARGQKPKFFEVGTIDKDGKEEVKILATSEVHDLISGMNKTGNIVTLIIKKKTNQREMYKDG